jgi:hypothetical protein
MLAIAVQLAAVAAVVAANDGQFDVPISEVAERYTHNFGLLPLPEINYNKLPPECDAPTNESCTAEAAGDYETAFSMYESRLTTCGWKGFERKRMTGEGSVAPVFLLTSPCGLKLTGKFGRKEVAVKHIYRNCDFLRQLRPHLHDPGCNGCFPEYFYYSNITGVCYAEMVHALPMDSFLAFVNRSQPESLLSTVKLAMHQGMNAIRILQSLHMRHQDLTFRNVMTRIKPKNDPAPFRVVLYDFGVSFQKGLPQQIRKKRGGGNHGFPDAHAWACAFYSYFYNPGADLHNGCAKISRDLDRFSEDSLRYVLLDMMHKTLRNYDNVDYTVWQSRISKVNQL